MTRIEGGRRVRVVSVDDCGDESFIGCVGTVVSQHTSGMGVCESEGDPFIIVDFGNRSDGFWTEELEVVGPHLTGREKKLKPLPKLGAKRLNEIRRKLFSKLLKDARRRATS